MLEIYTYNAGKGDCIRIRFGNRHNIIVDTGITRFASKFLDLCKDIERNKEIIDAVIITHMDDDHLGGALFAARRNKTLNINEFWLNAKNTLVENKGGTPLSANQNNELYSLIISKGIPVRSVIKGDSINIEGAEINILWPPKDIAEKVYCETRNTKLSYTSDRKQKLSTLADDDITDCDSSLSNRASIVFTFYYENKKLLFTGDAWGVDIINTISDYSYDMIKLSHHGSIRNLTEEWKKIKCNNYLICTDGKSHPDKQTIAKIHKWNGNIVIYSPSDWWSNGFFLDEDNNETIRCVKSDGKPIII